MASNTTNYNFKKPDESDFYSVQDQNGNWDKADDKLHAMEYPDFEDYASGTTLPDAEAALAQIQSAKKHTSLFTSIKAVLSGAFLKKYILKTMEEVMANTVAGRTADALLVKQINSNIDALSEEIVSGFSNAGYTGYCDLPNGLQFRWGFTNPIALTANVDVSYVHTLNKPFTHKCLHTFITPGSPAVSTLSQFFYDGSFADSATQFKIRAKSTVDSTVQTRYLCVGY